MKNINKKYIYVIIGILAAFLLTIVLVVIVRACQGPGNNYEKVEQQMVVATTKYFSNEKNKAPEEFENMEVTSSDLIAAGVLDPMDKLLEDSTCTGKVSVYNNDNQLLYIPDLKCSKYSTNHLVDQIKKDSLIKVPENNTSDENIVSDSNLNSNVSDSNSQINSDPNLNSNVNDENLNNQSSENNDYISGLYEMDGQYVFRGKSPNNYISFGEILWRIIDIDENGIMRVMKVESENKAASWDQKFNYEAGRSHGINDYKNSNLLEILNSFYAGFKDESKLHLSSYNVCIGKRDSKTKQVDRSIDCAEKLENQYISVISVADFSRASLDEHCTSITSGSCTNYNYLSLIVPETWTSTAVSENTEDVLIINGGVATSLMARETGHYSWVVAFNGNEKYVSGNGTQDNPYLLVPPSK